MRVWDRLLFEGSAALFHTSIAFLKLKEGTSSSFLVCISLSLQTS